MIVFLEGALQTTQHLSPPQHRLPPPNGWENGGGEQILGDIFKVFCEWKAT